MDRLNNLEIFALQQIADSYDDGDQLSCVFQSLVVVKRENTGRGFFTTVTLEAKEAFIAIGRRSPLGDALIDIEGLQHGIGCLVFLTEGYPTLLEGYSLGGEDTSSIDFNNVSFENL